MATIAEIDGEQIDDIAKVDNCDVPGAVLAEDIIGTGISVHPNTDTSMFKGINDIVPDADADSAPLATNTQAYDVNSMAVAVGSVILSSTNAATAKLRLYMDGVQVAESGWILTVGANGAPNLIVIATRALVGNATCYIAAHNYGGAPETLWICGGSQAWTTSFAIIGIGSIKLA